MLIRRKDPPPFESKEWFEDWWEDDHHWVEKGQSFRFYAGGGGDARNNTSQRRSTDDYVRDGKVLMAEKGVTPLDYLQSVMEGVEQPSMAQMQAATAILPYRHRKQPVAVENSGPDGKPLSLNVAVRFVKPGAE